MSGCLNGRLVGWMDGWIAYMQCTSAHNLFLVDVVDLDSMHIRTQPQRRQMYAWLVSTPTASIFALFLLLFVQP